MWGRVALSTVQSLNHGAQSEVRKTHFESVIVIQVKKNDKGLNEGNSSGDGKESPESK